MSLAPNELWERLRRGPVSFGVRSWRRWKLEDVRDEVSRILGCTFSPCDLLRDGTPAYCAETRAAEISLNAWPAPDSSGRFVFNLVGFGPMEIPPTISEEMAAHLRAHGGDWYVPSKLEMLEEAGLLKGPLDADTLVAILGPRWLAWCDAAEREEGGELLRRIARLWLAEAAGDAAALTRRRNELESWGADAPGPARRKILLDYACDR
jgi:hypothetical protein